MGEATGVLKVVTPTETKTLRWNGVPEDKAAAKAEFEKRMATGAYLATVVDSPKSSTQVRTFDEIEAVEKERGLVEARISPALVGG